jgi:chromosome partitioning protein
MPQAEIIVKNAIGSRNATYAKWYPNLDFVSAQFELDDTEIDLASTSYGNVNLSDWDKRTLLASWLDSIDAHNQYDYVIFDCPPATKIVSQKCPSGLSQRVRYHACAKESALMKWDWSRAFSHWRP